MFETLLSARSPEVTRAAPSQAKTDVAPAGAATFAAVFRGGDDILLAEGKVPSETLPLPKEAALANNAEDGDPAKTGTPVTDAPLQSAPSTEAASDTGITNGEPSEQDPPLPQVGPGLSLAPEMAKRAPARPHPDLPSDWSATPTEEHGQWPGAPHTRSDPVFKTVEKLSKGGPPVSRNALTTEEARIAHPADAVNDVPPALLRKAGDLPWAASTPAVPVSRVGAASGAMSTPMRSETERGAATTSDIVEALPADSRASVAASQTAQTPAYMGIAHGHEQTDMAPGQLTGGQDYTAHLLPGEPRVGHADRAQDASPREAMFVHPSRNASQAGHEASGIAGASPKVATAMQNGSASIPDQAGVSGPQRQLAQSAQSDLPHVKAEPLHRVARATQSGLSERWSKPPVPERAAVDLAKAQAAQGALWSEPAVGGARMTQADSTAFPEMVASVDTRASPEAARTLVDPTLSQPRAADITRQIVAHVAPPAISNGEQKIEITLNPAELGRVRLTMTPGDAAMTVSITAERPETLDLIRRHIDILGQDFRDMGYERSEFSFGQGQHHSPDTGERADAPVDALTAALEDTSDPAQGRALRVALDGLDIRI